MNDRTSVLRQTGTSVRWGLTIAGLVWLLFPRASLQAVFERRVPVPAHGQTEDPTVRVSVPPTASALQRIWIADPDITHVDVFLFREPEDSSAPVVHLRVREDAEKQPGDVIQEAKAAPVRESSPTVWRLRSSFASALPGPRQWIWLDISVDSPARPLVLSREIGSENYPGGSLKLATKTSSRELPGVLDFALVYPSRRLPELPVLLLIVLGVTLLWLPSLITVELPVSQQ